MPQSREGETQDLRTSRGKLWALRSHSDTKTEERNALAHAERTGGDDRREDLAAIISEPRPPGSLAVVMVSERTGTAKSGGLAQAALFV
ncbi:hypothetical protein ABIB73_003950 [Bradyrhizobium sp. F1.4.3]